MGQLAGVITASLPTSEAIALSKACGWRARWCAARSRVKRLLPRRSSAASRIQGSSAMRAVSRKGSSFFAIPSGSIAALTLPGVTMTCLIERAS